MTLTPEQWDLIDRGIPCNLADGSTLHKFWYPPFTLDQDANFPLIEVSIVSQGIPVDQLRLLEDFWDSARKVRKERWGHRCRARVSCVIEDPDISTVRRLASLFSHALYEKELGINPLENKMQFRGVDPPQNLPPYNNPLTVYRTAIDFFVEYEFSWIKDFDLIREIEIEIDGPKEPIIYKFDKHNFSYSLDVIIES